LKAEYGLRSLYHESHRKRQAPRSEAWHENSAYVETGFGESGSGAVVVGIAKMAATPSRKSVRRGAMEVSLPNGARLSLDADVDTDALRRVLSVLGDLCCFSSRPEGRSIWR
jgi:hypothetical protein